MPLGSDIPRVDLSPSTAFLFYLGTIMNPQASKGWIKSGISSMNKVDCSAMRAALGTLVITLPLLLGGHVESRAAGQQNVPEGKKESSKTDLEPKDRQVDRKPDEKVDDWQLVQLHKNDPAFKSINDRKPLAEPLENPEEFNAFVQVMLHARSMPDELLARHSLASTAYASLVDDGARVDFLRSLLKIKGRLIRYDESGSPSKLKDAGAKSLYRALIAVGGDPDKPIFVYFSDRPPELLPGDGGNVTVECDGYYFKLVQYRVKQDGFENVLVDKYAPLLLAKTVKVVKIEEPDRTELSEEQRVRLDKKDPGWDSVIDERPLGSLEDNPEEYRQYNLVFKQASEIAPEVLRKHARGNVVYADMVGDGRDEYLRELLHVEGTLVRLRKRNATGRLRETSSIKEVYEGWIRLDSTSAEKEDDRLINIVFSELPEGLKPGEGNYYKHRVAFDGYYFKRLGYESPEKDKKSGKKIWRKAPMMIGRTIEPLDVAEPMNPMIPVLLAMLGLAGAAMVGLMFWFRRGDRKVHDRSREALTNVNPFEQAGPTAVESSEWNRPADPSQP